MLSPNWKLCKTCVEEFFVPEMCALNTVSCAKVTYWVQFKYVFGAPHISCTQIFKCVQKIFRMHDKVSRLVL